MLTRRSLLSLLAMPLLPLAKLAGRSPEAKNIGFDIEAWRKLNPPLDGVMGVLEPSRMPPDIYAGPVVGIEPYKGGWIIASATKAYWVDPMNDTWWPFPTAEGGQG